MRKWIVIVAAAGLAISLGIVTGAGGGSQSAGVRHVFDAKVGDAIIIRALDLYCRVYRRDPDRHETGPMMSCRRNSSYRLTRAIGASRSHYFVTRPDGIHLAYRVVR